MGNRRKERIKRLIETEAKPLKDREIKEALELKCHIRTVCSERHKLRKRAWYYRKPLSVGSVYINTQTDEIYQLRKINKKSCVFSVSNWYEDAQITDVVIRIPKTKLPKLVLLTRKNATRYLEVVYTNGWYRGWRVKDKKDRPVWLKDGYSISKRKVTKRPSYLPFG